MGGKGHNRDAQKLSLTKKYVQNRNYAAASFLLIGIYNYFFYSAIAAFKFTERKDLRSTDLSPLFGGDPISCTSVVVSEQQALGWLKKREEIPPKRLACFFFLSTVQCPFSSSTTISSSRPISPPFAKVFPFSGGPKACPPPLSGHLVPDLEQFIFRNTFLSGANFFDLFTAAIYGRRRACFAHLRVTRHSRTFSYFSFSSPSLGVHPRLLTFRRRIWGRRGILARARPQRREGNPTISLEKNIHFPFFKNTPI